VEIINPLIESYAAKYTSEEDDLLKSIADETRNSHPHAQMLSGHVQGKFLQFISKIIRPRRVLEIGTFTGYSAICLSKGLTTDGQLHTIELREEDAVTSQRNFNRTDAPERIILHRGNALEIIPTLKETWDLVFIDADKISYVQYLKLVLPSVRDGGVIIADNVLFHGEVTQQPVTGKNAKAISEFNDYVASEKRLETVLLTMRDGLMLMRKI
jgi:caffeoyl-CoA O-methyltransferase